MSRRQLPVLEAPGAVACCTPLAAEEISEADAKTVAAQFAALSDPVRVRLVSLLATSPDGAICVCDLVEPTGKSQPTVSHHLKILVENSLVRGEKRGRNMWYSVNPDAFEAMRAVIAFG